MNAEAGTLQAHYFDGRSARPYDVHLHVSEDRLHIRGDEVALDLPLRDVQWPERTRHGPRIAHLHGGGSLHCSDGARWDAFARVAHRRDSLVVRAQQSWRVVAIALLSLIVVCAAGYRWGVPLAAGGLLTLVPPSVDRRLGEAALHALRERDWLTPSTRPAAEQRRLREAFALALEQAGGEPAAFEIHFYGSRRLGPNALALPGGIILLTDELVALLGGNEHALVGVLAHELGHVRHRHGMRLLAQGLLLGAATGVLLGDFSSVAAGASLLVGELAYSRAFEREADAEALRVLRGSGRDPRAMLLLFDGLARERGEHDVGIALSSHPADEERRRLFSAGP